MSDTDPPSHQIDFGEMMAMAHTLVLATGDDATGAIKRLQLMQHASRMVFEVWAGRLLIDSSPFLDVAIRLYNRL